MFVSDKIRIKVESKLLVSLSITPVHRSRNLLCNPLFRSLDYTGHAGVQLFAALAAIPCETLPGVF